MGRHHKTWCQWMVRDYRERHSIKVIPYHATPLYRCHVFVILNVELVSARAMNRHLMCYSWHLLAALDISENACFTCEYINKKCKRFHRGPLIGITHPLMFNVFIPLRSLATILAWNWFQHKVFESRKTKVGRQTCIQARESVAHMFTYDLFHKFWTL